MVLVNFLHKLLGVIKLMSSVEKYPIILARCIAITMSSFTNDFHKHEKLATSGELRPNIGYSFLVCIRNAFLY